MLGKNVGAIIKNEKREYLVEYRLKHPFGLALPAGHLEDGEDPEVCLKRELLEETGLKVISCREVLHDTFPSECAKGHNGHEWWVYDVVAEGEPILREPDKHGFVKFMSSDEIGKYIRRKEYDPGWFDY